MIDVLIPAYNAEKTVAAALSSILTQTVKDIRLIVIDDGSTDQTGHIIGQIAARDARVTLISTQNGGIVSALNTGLEVSTAKYIARHDADDLAYPDRLEKQLAYLEAHPDCLAVGANARHVNENGEPIGVTNWSGDAMGNFKSIPAYEPYLMHPLLLVRASALRQVAGYRYVLHSEDSDLYWRLIQVGRLYNLPDVLMDYRIHGSSITSGSRTNVRVAAVCSQMGAISARRRADGKADLVFDKRFAARIQRAPDLNAMIEIASEHLTTAESRYLRIATAAKMTDLRVYRQFSFEMKDVIFIARQLLTLGYMLNLTEIRHLAARPVHYARPRVRLRIFLRLLGLEALAARL